jgi:hypothetical protein
MGSEYLEYQGISYCRKLMLFLMWTNELTRPGGLGRFTRTQGTANITPTDRHPCGVGLSCDTGAAG